MPVYLAGYVNANATVRFGSGFTVSRWFVAGSYRITIPAATSTKFFAPVATSVALHTVARIALIQRDALTGNLLFDIEIRDLTTDALVDGARWMSRQIPGSTFLEVPGADHLPYIGDTEPILAAAQEFLTGVRPAPVSERLLATLLFTDIVRSTEHAAELGDRRWVALLQAHRVLVRQEIGRWRGEEIDTAGDGFLITFDGPARAIRCAQAILTAAAEQGLQVRAGLHTGEIERRGSQIGGIAVHIAARVTASAEPGEVLVSSTVRDLVAGSGIRFEDRGTHRLKGVPDPWRLFGAEGKTDLSTI